ncbi:TonB-dependent receptor [Ensifer sp. LC163]|uniref:TonB-dependent receptor n=1 Tax=Ensifer sp. LC163 TaxID=1120652 RepID=UPI00111211D5|nr:TonB-dependent receptor [Ensifer sp. LC163]
MSGTLTLGTRLYDETLTLGGRVTCQGERAVDSKSTSSGGYTASIAWEPYALVDLFATYKINDNASFDLSIDNVTDVYDMDALTLGLMPSPG